MKKYIVLAIIFVCILVIAYYSYNFLIFHKIDIFELKQNSKMDIYAYRPFETLIYSTENTEIIDTIVEYVSSCKFRRARDMITGGGYNIVITNNKEEISFGVCGTQVTFNGNIYDNKGSENIQLNILDMIH